MGYTKIKKAVGKMTVGACFIDLPDEAFCIFDAVMTDSGRLAHTRLRFIPKTNVIIGSFKECIDAAT